MTIAAKIESITKKERELGDFKRLLIAEAKKRKQQYQRAKRAYGIGDKEQLEVIISIEKTGQDDLAALLLLIYSLGKHQEQSKLQLLEAYRQAISDLLILVEQEETILRQIHTWLKKGAPLEQKASIDQLGIERKRLYEQQAVIQHNIRLLLQEYKEYIKEHRNRITNRITNNSKMQAIIDIIEEHEKAQKKAREEADNTKIRIGLGIIAGAAILFFPVFATGFFLALIIYGIAKGVSHLYRKFYPSDSTTTANEATPTPATATAPTTTATVTPPSWLDPRNDDDLDLSRCISDNDYDPAPPLSFAATQGLFAENLEPSTPDTQSPPKVEADNTPKME